MSLRRYKPRESFYARTIFVAYKEETNRQRPKMQETVGCMKSRFQEVTGEEEMLSTGEQVSL